MSAKNIAVIGAGHNPLVTAAYLARAGHKVTVFERRSAVGGCASSDSTTFPGFTLSTGAYLVSLFLEQIVEDLGLKRFDYEVLPRNPSSLTPHPGAGYLMLGPDMESNKREIGKFSKDDAEAYEKYEEILGEIGAWMSAGMTLTPFNFPPKNRRDWKNVARALRHRLRLSKRAAREFRLLRRMDPLAYLNRWFESDILKATLLTDAFIGAVKPQGYVLLHHVMGMAGGARGVWGYMRGGMGTISKALAKAGEEYGVRIIRDAAVMHIEPQGSGKPIRIRYKKTDAIDMLMADYDIVVSGLDPFSTFDLIDPGTNKKALAIDKKIRNIDFASGTMKVNLICDELPDFIACPGTEPGPQHRGTIHLPHSTALVLESLADYNDGIPSRRPIIEMTIPSACDDTLAPPGKHVVNLFIQFVPFLPKDGPWTKEKKEAYWRDAILPQLRLYMRNADTFVIDKQILTPEDLQKEFGIYRGNIFHGALSPDQLFCFRPIRGMADYRTHIPGFYLCGSGCHPGGGVTGAPGYNAAREILADIGIVL